MRVFMFGDVASWKEVWAHIIYMRVGVIYRIKGCYFLGVSKLYYIILYSGFFEVNF